MGGRGRRGAGCARPVARPPANKFSPRGRTEKERLTALPVANFFSVPMMLPVRWASLMAPLPRTTVSREEEPPPETLLPILVTVSQSSDILDFFL